MGGLGAYFAVDGVCVLVSGSRPTASDAISSARLRDDYCPIGSHNPISASSVEMLRLDATINSLFIMPPARANLLFGRCRVGYTGFVHPFYG